MLVILILAVVQALTEFLPVSSSGHLVLFQALLDTSRVSNEVAFDVALHLGTLVPVLIYYRADLRGLFSSLHPKADGAGPSRTLLLCLFLGSIPTAIIGLSLQDPLEALFHVPRAVGVSLLLTAGLLLLTLKAKPTGRSIDWRLALLLGVVQGLAITPGISRSGSTIAVALLLGVERKEAARFSFLLSVPAIGGAALLQLRQLVGGVEPTYLLLGMLTAAVVGYGALTLLVRLVDKGRLWIFAPYVAGLGLLAIVLG